MNALCGEISEIGAVGSGSAYDARDASVFELDTSKEVAVLDEPAFPLTTPCMPVLACASRGTTAADCHSFSQVHFLHVNTLQVAREMLVKANSNLLLQPPFSPISRP
jgi:hypothetical protein